MKKKYNITNTLIRYSADGKTWSNKMTIENFIKRSPSAVILVEISEVMDRKEALKLLQ